MIVIEEYLADFPKIFSESETLTPWDFISQLPEILRKMISELDDDFIVRDDVAIHKTADVDSTALIRGPAIIEAHVLVGAYALIRNGAYVGRNSIVGAHVEFKNSILMYGSACGHLNFVGESLIGSGVNLEAGAVLANHYNELRDKNVWVKYQDALIDTGFIKFGSVIGDSSRIGANAVLSPGILLPKNTVIKRLQLVETLKMH
ncbi:MAG TPA: DapH/DapD/GlmU-related protein [Chitinophagales bacterium]|nr:DapH/DapD/GlmU-related protein [Chitinophagales bacterium]